MNLEKFENQYFLLLSKPYIKYFQSYPSVKFNSLLRLRQLISVNKSEHCVSILLINAPPPPPSGKGVGKTLRGDI